MATRTIPSDVQPYWSCTVNGKKYTYKSGETADVPDAVASVIDAINEGNKRPMPEYVPTLPVIGDDDEGKVVKVNDGRYVLEEDGGGGGGAGLPDVTTEDNGKVLGVEDGEWAPVTPDYHLPLSCTTTVTTNEQDKTVVTFNKTAEELYQAAAMGRLIHGVADGEDMTVDSILPIETFRIDNGGIIYRFKMRMDANGDSLYMTDWLLGSDAVVAVEV